MSWVRPALAFDLVEYQWTLTIMCEHSYREGLLPRRARLTTSQPCSTATPSHCCGLPRNMRCSLCFIIVLCTATQTAQYAAVGPIDHALTRTARYCIPTLPALVPSTARASQILCWWHVPSGICRQPVLGTASNDRLDIRQGRSQNKISSMPHLATTPGVQFLRRKRA